MFKSAIIAAAVAATLSSGTAYAAAHAPSKALHTVTIDGEKILTNVDGMTLYIFDKDKKGVSNCNDGCAAKWPPLMAPTNAQGKGQFSVITRADGTKQWAVNGMVLYTWFKDKKAGDTTGDGIKGVWHVAKP